MKLKLFLFSITLLLAASCSKNDQALSKEPMVITLSVPANMNDSIADKPFSNPALIYGSTFGNFFQILYFQGKFDDMLKFTSQTSLRGREAEVLKHYENMSFGFSLDLLGQSKEGDTITLNYKSQKVATKHATRIRVVVENDSCKVVLPNDLSKFPN